MRTSSRLAIRADCVANPIFPSTCGFPGSRSTGVGVRLEFSTFPFALALESQGRRIDDGQDTTPILRHFAVDRPDGPGADAIVLTDRPSAEIGQALDTSRVAPRGVRTRR